MSEAPRWKNEPARIGLAVGPQGRHHLAQPPPRRAAQIVHRGVHGAAGQTRQVARCVPVDEGPLLPPLTGVADCPGVWLLATVFPATSTGILRIASRSRALLLGEPQGDVEAPLAFDHLAEGLSAHGRLAHRLHVAHLEVPPRALAPVDGQHRGSTGP